MTLQEKKIWHKSIYDRLKENETKKDLSYDEFVELSHELTNLSIQIRAEDSILSGEWKKEQKTFSVPVFKNLKK